MPAVPPLTIFHGMMETRNDAEAIRVTVNGEARDVGGGWTLADLLADLRLEPRTVVVEHNREIVRDRGLLARVELAPGDTIELVHFVGGG
jgi:thiamine biosynthesis protein ThiS